MLSQWVAEALARSRITGAELGRILTARLGRSIDRAAVSKMISGQRKVAGDEMLVISEVTGHPPPADSVPTQMVPLISWVQAGELTAADGVMLFDDCPTVPMAGLPSGDWFALEVVGDSMDRISPPESIIIVNRRERTLHPNACFVFADADGAATYKRYRPSPDRLEPVSTNPRHEPIYVEHQPVIIGRVRFSFLKM